MNRTTFALFVALLIHILIFLLLWIFIINIPQIKKREPKEEKIKIALQALPKKQKESSTQKQKPKPQKIAPPMPKGKQLKKIVKSQKPTIKPLRHKSKQSKQTPHKEQKKVTPLPLKKAYHPLLEAKEDDNQTKKGIQQKNPLAWMYEDRSLQEKKSHQKKVASGSNIAQDIKELYGEEFGKLTAGEQKYILDNQEIMRRITQQVLTRVASVNIPRNLNVNRSNVIEFYLHPNGDMTDFKFLSKSGYYILDETTKETIEYAYSKYPHPTEKTLIRYNVYYNLARY